MSALRVVRCALVTTIGWHIAAALCLAASLQEARASLPLTNTVQVVAGGAHSCALTAAGGLKCWGANARGQLGNGTTSDATTAVDVVGLDSGVSAVALGDSHTCAIVYGGVKCWGDNSFGQLGIGNTASARVPVAVAGIASGATSLAAGGNHTCVAVGGGAKCWGANGDGQLGNGSIAGSTTAVDVTGLASGVMYVAAGPSASHTCAVVAGGAKCWGDNEFGQLGDGTIISRTTAVDVIGLASGVTALAPGGFHTCAIVGGGARCWGRNEFGQLGDGTTTLSTTAVGVQGLASGTTALTAGAYHSCAIVDGGAKCWGSNHAGQLGDGSTVAAASAVPVTGLASGVSAVSAGAAHTCATANGTTRCWGDIQSGRLGNGTTVIQTNAIGATGLEYGVTALAAGTAHTCAIRGGGASCWGSNADGQLGDGTTAMSTTAVGVQGLATGVAMLAAGASHSCAVVNGGAKCWGANWAGQLGSGTTDGATTPVQVAGLTSGVTALAAGMAHTCAVVGGSARCWGHNAYGQLGNGTKVDAKTPAAVAGLTSGVTAIAAGAFHTCAVVNGAVKCWGYNADGQLGNAAVWLATTPVDATGLASGAAALAAGSQHTCAIVGDGAACWGDNSYGQLGNGTHADTSTANAVTGLATGVTALSAGEAHTCAVVDGGTRCWGRNDSGQLGNGTIIGTTTPAPVTGVQSGATAVVSGAHHTCAVAGGGARCWGSNFHGQLGNGVAWFQPVPTEVVIATPAARTAPAQGVTATGATLNGVISSNGDSTAVTFEYGTTMAYGGTVKAVQSPVAGSAMEMPVSATITGMSGNTAYHYRVVGRSGGGTAIGSDEAFTTAAVPGTVATHTTIASEANPSPEGTLVKFTATVAGVAPTGTVAFLDAGVPVPGCGAAVLVGSGDVRKATCTTDGLGGGAHSLVAEYGGNPSNVRSASTTLVQQVVKPLPAVGGILANPYGPMSVQGGTLNGNVITLTSSVATIQLGGLVAPAGAVARIGFDGLHVGQGDTLIVRSGAPGQVLELLDLTATGSAFGGTLTAEGGNGAPPPEVHLWSPGGIAIAASGRIHAPSGLTMDALDAAWWFVGNRVTNAGTVDGGVGVRLYAAGVHGGGTFRGDSAFLSTFGNANNPVHGADYLQNGLQLHPSTGTMLTLTLNGYGPGRQVFNLYAHGDASVWMPSAWPAGFTLPANNAVVAPGGTRPPGVPEPAYGGGSMIVQASGSLQLHGGGSNDFAFPGAIVLKAGATLDFNGVAVNQGWTTTGQSFQGLFFEAPSIVSANGLIQLYGNDLNWMNFSALPQQYVRAFSLKRNPDGSASFAATDGTAPHLNTYSVIQGAAAVGGCWVCLVNTAPVNVYGP